MGRPAARALRTTAIALAAVTAVVVIGASIVYLERRAIGLRLATDYLRARGVPATLRLDRLDAGGFSGALVLGDPADPDLSVERVDVEFAPLQLGVAGLTPPRVRAIRLFRPVLKAHLDARGLHFGSLQRLIDENAHASGGGGPLPDITLTEGGLRLATPAGAVAIQADGAVGGGRLVRLSLRMPSSDLAGDGVSARRVEGELRVATRADRSHAAWRFAARTLQTRAGIARDLEIRGEAEGPYPSDPARTSGRVDLTARLRSGMLSARGATVRGATSRLRIAGELEQTPRAVAFGGDAQAVLAATSMRLAGAAVDAPSLALEASRAKLAYTAVRSGRRALTIAAPIELRLAAGRLRDLAWSALRLDAAQTTARGRLRWSAQGLGLDLTGDAGVSARLAPSETRRLAGTLPTFVDARLRGVVARNLTSARVRIPGYRLAVAGRKLDLRFAAPARADFAAGATLELAPRSPLPLVALAGGREAGAFDVRVRGPGLPTATLEATHWSNDVGAKGPSTEVEVSIALDGDAGAVVGGFVRARARLVRRGSALVTTAPVCADFGFAAFGPSVAPSLRAVRARLCPAATPLFDLQKSGWSSAARVSLVHALAPGLGVAIAAADADVALRGVDTRGEVELTRLELTDTVKPARFQPLDVAGTATLARGAFEGALRLALERPTAPVARLSFAFDPSTQSGTAHLVSDGLRFSPHGLQPSSFAPMAAQWVSAVDGPLSLEAQVAWSGGRLTSRGEVRTTGLDLQTPAGRVHGLKGDLTLTSLHPLATASAQRLQAKTLDAALPLTDLDTLFEIDPSQLTLRRATASFAGGAIALDPLSLPLAASSEITGAVHVEHVDAATVLAEFGLTNSVLLQAKVSGALPLSLRSGALAVRAGRLAADGPGRLTIRREALGAAVTTAGTAGAQPNAVEDFAYQALESLAFDTLDAEVGSLPKGRLGVTLHVHGRHDPAMTAPTRVRLVDLLAGHAFDKPLPLPKGTGVDLTLDTSLNFNELLADYGALRATAGSATVQPASPRTLETGP